MYWVRILEPSAIADRLQIDRKTVRKYLASETFEAVKPKMTVAPPSKLDPYKQVIQSWLEEDRKNRYKQRHTAQRIHNRLAGTESAAYRSGSTYS